jgi:hypothetical protein
MESTISAMARDKKTIDKLIQMQCLQNKELITVFQGLRGDMAREGAFGRKSKVRKAVFAPREEPVGRGWNVPVNNC